MKVRTPFRHFRHALSEYLKKQDCESRFARCESSRFRHQNVHLGSFSPSLDLSRAAVGETTNLNALDFLWLIFIMADERLTFADMEADEVFARFDFEVAGFVFVWAFVGVKFDVVNIIEKELVICIVVFVVD